MRRAGSLLPTIVPPALFLTLVLVVWQALELWLDIPKILLPSPLEILSAATEKRLALAAAAWITSRAAISGFALAIILGTSSALIFSLSRLARRAIYPYMILLQTVPIVAIAPLIIIWLGGGLNSIIAIIAIISVFPVITNVTTGLTSIDPGLDALIHRMDLDDQMRGHVRIRRKGRQHLVQRLREMAEL